MEPNVALLLAADAVAEASLKEGTLCDEQLSLGPNRIQVCTLPWNHPPPHSWEPAELKKILKRAPPSEIRFALYNSKKLEPWKAELCKTELESRGESW